LIGRTVSHYEIVEQIGEGGMGVVYKARDTVLPRHVALKVLPLQDADEERRQRFLREAKTSSALNHPHIITIHDVVSEDDADYIVMEYIEGDTLADRLRGGPLPLPDALRFAAEAAEGIATAHGAGIVHRDLKPANLMISASGHVKVLDFGLARLTGLTEVGENDDTATVQRTRTGTLLGTFNYMSPEQARGEAVDERSDIFSLGVVLYEMLTGERPFRGDNPVSTLQNIALSEPRPPAELRGDLPADVDAIVRRALVKERDGRYQTMAEMAADLRAVASGVTPSAAISAASAAISGESAARSGASAGPFSVREPIAPAPLSRLGKVAVPLLVVAALLWAGRDRLPWLGSGTAGDETGAPSGETATELPTTPFGHYQAGLAYLARFDRPGYLDEALDSFQRAIGMDEQYAPGYAGYARASWLEYRSSQDDIWLDRARNNAERSVELSPQLSFARATLAQVLVEQGELDAAQQNIDAALAADPDSPEAHTALAYLHRTREEPDAAEAEYLRAVALRPDDWSARQDLADFYFTQGRYEEALAPAQEAVRLTPDNGTAHRDLAAVQQQLGDYAAAARSLQQSLEINATAAGYSNLGTLYFYQSMYQQSVDAFEQALQLGANDYLIWANLGDAYRWTPDNEDKAREAYQRALQLLEPELGRNPDDPTLRSRHALYLAKSGAGAGALADLALIDWRTSDDLNLLYRIIPAYEIAGDRDTALEVLEAALEAGLPISFITDEPELTDLRTDPRYHRIAARFSGQLPD